VTGLERSAARVEVPSAVSTARLSKFAIRTIRRKARRLVRCAGFTAADREDLEQELMLKVWEALEKFDPDLSHPHAFVATVVERAAATILRSQKALKRGNHLGHCSLGLAAFSEDCQDGPADAAAIELTSTPSHEAPVDLAHDVVEVLSQLRRELREVAERLGSRSKRQIAKELGISRSTLDRRIDALREQFIAASLDGIS